MGAAHTCLNKVPCPGRVNGCAGAGPKGDAGLRADAEARSPEPAAARERGSGSPTPRHGWSLSFLGGKMGRERATGVREPFSRAAQGRIGPAGSGGPGVVGQRACGRALGCPCHPVAVPRAGRRVAQPWCCGRDSSQAGARARREGSDVPGLDPLPGPRGCHTQQPPAAAQMGGTGLARGAPTPQGGGASGGHGPNWNRWRCRERVGFMACLMMCLWLGWHGRRCCPALPWAHGRAALCVSSALGWRMAAELCSARWGSRGLPRELPAPQPCPPAAEHLDWGNRVLPGPLGASSPPAGTDPDVTKCLLWCRDPVPHSGHQLGGVEQRLAGTPTLCQPQNL